VCVCVCVLASARVLLTTRAIACVLPLPRASPTPYGCVASEEYLEATHSRMQSVRESVLACVGDEKERELRRVARAEAVRPVHDAKRAAFMEDLHGETARIDADTAAAVAQIKAEFSNSGDAREAQTNADASSNEKDGAPVDGAPVDDTPE
jgi:hypothetical protein